VTKLAFRRRSSGLDPAEMKALTKGLIFFGAYRHAAERLRSGALDGLFPEGAFPPALPCRPAPG